MRQNTREPRIGERELEGELEVRGVDRTKDKVLGG